MIIDRTQAILRLVPNAEFQLIADDLSTLNWESDPAIRPSDAEIEQSLIDLQSEWTAQEYARNRASAYDSVGDQLDQLMKDMRDGTTTHKDACEAVKAKFPKP